MKKVFLLLFLCCYTVFNAQNKPVIYGFDNIPQGLLLNPGMETTYKAHIGFPLLSGLHAGAGISGFTLSDLFANDGVGLIGGTDFNVKLKNVIDGLNGNKDYLTINSQIEVLSGGYKLNDRDYLSLGFYTEADVFVGFPKDLALLYMDGNASYINKTFYASDVNIKADVLGVLHFGLTRKFNNKFTAGARLKIYSGSLNVTSTNNEGTHVTNSDSDEGIYDHNFSNLNIAVHSSGILDENDESLDLSAGSVFGGTILSKNFGLGLDLGFTYHVNEQIEITGSFLDLGFLSYAKNNRNGYLNGNYSFSGVDYVLGNDSAYYEEFGDELEDSLVFTDDTESYTVARPLKLNAAVRYSFGQSRYQSNCHDTRKKDFYDNAVGAQIYSVFRPNGMRLAFTGFYERKFAEFLNTKVTWTVDDFSATNFGLGISSRIWKFNVYGALNNIFGLTNLSNAHTASAQFGINFLIN